MLHIMKVSKLDGYLFGCIPKPDITTDPVLHHHGPKMTTTCWLPWNVHWWWRTDLGIRQRAYSMDQPHRSTSSKRFLYLYFQRCNHLASDYNCMRDLCAHVYAQQSPLKMSCSCSLCLLDLSVKQTTLILKWPHTMSPTKPPIPLLSLNALSKRLCTKISAKPLTPLLPLRLDIVIIKVPIALPKSAQILFARTLLDILDVMLEKRRHYGRKKGWGTCETR